jgi:hypothetical protein
MTERSAWRALALITLVALGLRLSAVVALRAWEQPSFMEHRQIAINLLNGDGFSFIDWGHFGPSSVQSPPYPLLLAGLFKLFGPDSAAAFVVAMVINCVVGAMTCVLAYLLVRAMRGTRRVGVVTAALLAVWPTQVYAVTVVQAIALIIACTVAIVWLWYRSIDTARIRPWVAFGIIGCVAALTEPVLLPAMALSGLIILAVRSLPLATRFRNASLLLLIAIAVIGPWTYRNWLVHGEFMPIKATFWVNVWKGNNPHASGTDRPVLSEAKRQQLLEGMSESQRRDPRFDDLRQYDLLTPEQRARLQGKPEVQREKIFGEWAKAWIGENPGEYLRLCAVRLGKTLWVEWDNPKSYRLANVVSRTALLVLTPIGLVLAIRRRWRLGFALLIVGTSLLTYTLTITAARFAFPLEPFQLSLVALVGVWAWDRLRGRDADDEQPAADRAATASLASAT